MAMPVLLTTKKLPEHHSNPSKLQGSFLDSVNNQSLTNNEPVNNDQVTLLVKSPQTLEKQRDSQSTEIRSDNPVPTKKSGFLSNLFNKIKSFVKKEPWLALAFSIGIVAAIVGSIISAGLIPSTIAALTALYSLILCSEACLKTAVMSKILDYVNKIYMNKIND